MNRTVLETRCAVWRAYTRATGKEALPNPVPEPLDEFVTGRVADCGFTLAAPEGAVSTANGIIATAMFIGGGILISLSGGWSERGGCIVCFLVMSACALLGELLQLFTQRPKHDPAQEPKSASQASVAG